MVGDFAVAGNIVIDDLVYADGTTKWAVPGGNAIYAALGMAVWGERASVVAPVGPDYPVKDVCERLDLSRCRPVERTMRNWGLYEEDGSRTFVFRSATRNWADFSPVLADFDGLRSDFLHIAPLSWALQTELAVRLRERGARLLSVDPDDRYLDALDRAAILRLLASVDLFLPSRQEVHALLPGKTPLEALRALRDLAPALPLIAVKCGADGVILHAAGESDVFSVQAIATQVVDATGAGDAFSGGALVGLARTASALEAVLRGSVSASFAVEDVGPFGLVRAEVGQAELRLETLRARVDAHAF